MIFRSKPLSLGNVENMTSWAEHEQVFPRACASLRHLDLSGAMFRGSTWSIYAAMTSVLFVFLRLPLQKRKTNDSSRLSNDSIYCLIWIILGSSNLGICMVIPITLLHGEDEAWNHPFWQCNQGCSCPGLQKRLGSLWGYVTSCRRDVRLWSSDERRTRRSTFRLSISPIEIMLKGCCQWNLNMFATNCCGCVLCMLDFDSMIQNAISTVRQFVSRHVRF